MRTERQASDVSPVATGPISMSRDRLRTTLSRRRRWRTGSSSLRSGPTTITVGAAAVLSIVALGRSRISAGSPSPSCASRCSMPTASASRAHAKASSLVPRAPPSRATRFTRPASIVVRSALATAARATVHEVSVRPDSWDSPRTSGVVTRSGELTASKLNRPRSHSHPQLTASLSTPRWRTRWSRLDCTVIRHPTEQVVHVVSDSARSHGRALNRYGVAVSAPTGQICTVLPEKYELNG